MAKVFFSPATLVGASLAGAVLLAAYLGVLATDAASDAPQPPPARPVVLAPEPEAAPAAARPAVAAQEQRATQQVAFSATCPTQPRTAPRHAEDGRFTLEGALVSGATIEPGAFFTVAREAARQGRLRDAEVALLAACHIAERRGDAPAVAAAKGQIASLNDPAGPMFANAGERPATSVMGAARSSADAGAPGAAAEIAAAPVRRLISADPELAQLESDMARLHAQAISVTKDPAGLRQRYSAATARRDAACQDKACLLRWYAQAKRQLIEEF